MGAPIGNKNAVGSHIWRDAIMRALKKRTTRLERKEALDELAEQLLSKCDAADIAALKELGDRLDGKPTQVVAGDANNPLAVTLREILVRGVKGG